MVERWVRALGGRVSARDADTNAWAMDERGALTPVRVPVDAPLPGLEQEFGWVGAGRADLGMAYSTARDAGPVNRPALHMLCDWLAYDWPRPREDDDDDNAMMPPRGPALLMRLPLTQPYTRDACARDWPARFRAGVPYTRLTRADAARHAHAWTDDEEHMRRFIHDVLGEPCAAAAMPPTAAQRARAWATLAAAHAMN